MVTHLWLQNKLPLFWFEVRAVFKCFFFSVHYHFLPHPSSLGFFLNNYWELFLYVNQEGCISRFVKSGRSLNINKAPRLGHSTSKIKQNVRSYSFFFPSKYTKRSAFYIKLRIFTKPWQDLLNFKPPLLSLLILSPTSVVCGVWIVAMAAAMQCPSRFRRLGNSSALSACLRLKALLSDYCISIFTS